MNRIYKHLTPYDRYLIWIGVALGKSILEIALCLGRHRSTIYRELRRNCCKTAILKKTVYRRWEAQNKYILRRQNNLKSRMKIQNETLNWIEEGLKKQWSPEQIAGRAKLANSDFPCHETIYKFLYKQRLNNEGDLWKNLRRSRPRRRRRFGSLRNKNPWDNKKRPPLEARGQIVENRERLGDWERDLVQGIKEQGGALLTMVDRKSRLVRLKRLHNRNASGVHKATLSAFKNEKSLHTITNDNGCEFMDFKNTSEALNTPIFFTRPYAAWERGSIENMNGLIRQYFPKKTNFRKVTHAEIQSAQDKLNARPRKNLGFRTPEEVHRQST